MPNINETRLVCVKLPANLCPFTSEEQPRYLSIVFDERTGEGPCGSPPPGAQPHAQPHALTHQGKKAGLPFLPRYEAVSLACARRAVDTVDGTLRVNGKRIEPEAYLRRWRNALADAVTVDQLRKQGLQLVAEFILDPAAPCLSRRPTWTNPPFPSLAALLDARGGLTEISHRPDAESHPTWGQLSLDLSHPDAARDAWWLNDGLDDEHGLCRLRIYSLVGAGDHPSAAPTGGFSAAVTPDVRDTPSLEPIDELESLS